MLAAPLMAAGESWPSSVSFWWRSCDPCTHSDGSGTRRMPCAWICTTCQITRTTHARCTYSLAQGQAILAGAVLLGGPRGTTRPLPVSWDERREIAWLWRGPATFFFVDALTRYAPRSLAVLSALRSRAAARTVGIIIRYYAELQILCTGVRVAGWDFHRAFLL